MRDPLAAHAFYRGKIQTLPKCAVRDAADFSVWYSPGVAAPCRAIEADPAAAFEYTNRGNTVAVVSDGSRVLGLGNIGPAAALPVMEGKALLFKLLGGVDAVPLCVRTRSPEALVDVVRALEPSFGGVNLEDIAQPQCFAVLDRLRDALTIPVWHDDQQGSAVVALAGLVNALAIVGKRLEEVRIVLVGVGAANVAVYRLLAAAGVPTGNIVACDSRGILHPDRGDIPADCVDKARICIESNVARRRGGIAEALHGADVCIAFSRPDPQTIRPEWVRAMARDAIVFACANPEPEIWPDAARAAGARIVGTGRGDLPNQVNNALAFPAVFRGVLDVRARRITDTMAIAAARELAAFAVARGVDDRSILPRLDEWEVVPNVAAATGMAAIAEGVASVTTTRDALIACARKSIAAARAATAELMRAGLIASPARFGGGEGG